MIKIIRQTTWQLVILHRNNIVTISIAVTLIYGLISYLIRDFVNLDKVLITLVLNDPTVIGYFFIALSVYTEKKYDVLPAIFTTPINLHDYIISKTLALSLIGLLCAAGLAFFVKGFNFNILNYSIGALGICLLSSFLGLIVLTFASDFLKFAMLSVPFFLVFINVPMLHYLRVIDLNMIRYLFPVQGCIDLIENAISGTKTNFVRAFASILIWIPVFYTIAYKLFNKKIVRQ